MVALKRVVRLREVDGEIGGASLVCFQSMSRSIGLVQLPFTNFLSSSAPRVGLDRLALRLLPRLLPRLLIQVTERVEVVFAEPDVLSRLLGLVHGVVKFLPRWGSARPHGPGAVVRGGERGAEGRGRGGAMRRRGERSRLWPCSSSGVERA